jgi:hypothetical protein
MSFLKVRQSDFEYSEKPSLLQLHLQRVLFFRGSKDVDGERKSVLVKQLATFLDFNFCTLNYANRGVLT